MSSLVTVNFNIKKILAILAGTSSKELSSREKLLTSWKARKHTVFVLKSLTIESKQNE